MAAISPGNGTVLLVERDESVRTLAAVALRQAGFLIRAVADAAGARAVLDCAPVDVIVCDRVAGLPVEQLRRTIVATATPQSLRDADASRVFGVIRKPFGMSELVNAVTACAKAGDFGALRKFVSDIPQLRRVLASPAPSQREQLLRSEIRRMVLELSDAFLQAADVEPSRTRAAMLRKISAVAADLAAPPKRAAAHVSH